MIDTLTKLLVFQVLGEGVTYTLSLPIPGPVIGMVLMFVYLLARKGEAAKLAPVTSKLLGHLALFFVPAAVGIILHIQRVATEWIPITIALVTSTVLSITVTASVVHWLKK
jgi:holin-like protein